MSNFEINSPEFFGLDSSELATVPGAEQRPPALDISGSEVLDDYTEYIPETSFSPLEREIIRDLLRRGHSRESALQAIYYDRLERA